MTTRAAAVLAAALSLGLAACGGAEQVDGAPSGDHDPPAADRADDGPTDRAAADGDPADEGAFEDLEADRPTGDEIVTRPPSPVEEAFGILTDPEELSDVYGRAYQNHAEHAQTCIAEEGFTGYVVEEWPSPTPAEFGIVGSTTDALDRFGYGVTGTLRAQLEQLLRSGDPVAATGNTRFLDSLTPSEAEAFHRILDACTVEAWDRYPLPDTFPSQVSDDVVAIRTDALAAPEVVAAWDQWSGCMAAAGYDHRTREDAVGEVQQVANGANEQLAAIGSSGTEPSSAQVDELEAEIAGVEQFERQLIDADVVCAEESEVQRHIDEAVTRLETEWLEANGDRVALVLAEQPARWWED